MKSLINPFSVLRCLDLWSVATFDTGGGGGGGGGNDSRSSSVPTFNTYYDAIDAGYGGEAVNIGGDTVIAETADGYTGGGSYNSGGSSGSSSGGSGGGGGRNLDADLGIGGNYDYSGGSGSSSDLDAFGGAGADIDTGSSYVATTPIYGGTGSSVYTGGSTTTDLDAFGGAGPDIDTGSYSGGDNGSYGIGYGAGEVDPALANAIPGNSDYVADSSAGTVTYDPIVSGGTGTTTAGTGGYDGSTYDEIFSTGFNSSYGFDDDDEDYTPTSAELNAAITEAGGVNLTNSEYAEPVDYTTTSSGNSYISAAENDDDDPYVAPYVAPVYYDGFGNSYGTEAEAASADASAAEEARLAEESRLVEESRRVEEARLVEEARVEAERERAIQIALQSDPYENVTVDGREIYDTDVVPYAPEPFVPYAPEPVVSGGTGTTGIGPYDNVNDFDFDSISDFVDDSDPLEAFGGSGDPIEEMLVDLGINLETDLDGTERGITIEGAKTAPAAITDLAMGTVLPTGPFVDPEQTALEDIADLNYLNETNLNVAPDFMESLTDFDLAEIEAVEDEYYDTDPLSVPDQISIYDSVDLNEANDLSASDAMSPASTSYSVGSIINADIADILGDSTLEGQRMTIDDAKAVKEISERLGYDDVSVSLPEDINAAIAEADGTVSSDASSSTDLYLSAMDKVSADGYDPNNSNLTEAEQRALYGSRGQTPNAAETAYLQDLLGGAKHAKDGPIGADGEPLYKAGDDVTPATFGETAADFGIGLVDSFFNPLSLFGDDFTIGGIIGGISDASTEEQLEAYKNGGTFVYGEDGATVVGVAAPNYDASGDGNNDTVVLYDENGDFSVTGDGIAVEDIIESNSNSDGEEFNIDIVDSDMTYTNTEDGVVTTSTGSDGGSDGGPDDIDLVDPEICEEGFKFDPVEGICMPIDVTAALPDRPTTVPDPVVTTPVAPRPTTGGLTVRTPSFNRGGVVTRNIDKFANGGVVTKNIDNFLGGMR